MHNKSNKYVTLIKNKLYPSGRELMYNNYCNGKKETFQMEEDFGDGKAGLPGSEEDEDEEAEAFRM